MGRIWAVARHMIAEGLRMKIAIVVIAILLLVIAFPQGIVGFVRERFERDDARAGGRR